MTNANSAATTSPTDELRTLAEALVPGCWPTADDATLLDCGRRLRALGEDLRDLADAVDSARRDRDGSGRFHDALTRALAVVTTDADGMRATAERFTALAGSLEAFATATADARSEMTVLASIADRDRLAGSVAAALGDDSARVAAAGAGRYALSAAGDEYTERAHEAGDVTDREATQAAPPSATGGMMPMAGLAGLGAAGMPLGAALLHSPQGVAERALTVDIDPAALIDRAAVLQASLPYPFSEWMRVAVGVGVDENGEPVRVVATSDPQPYQRPGFAMVPSELLAGDGGPPEYAVVAEMVRSGVTPRMVATADPTPQGIASVLIAEGVEVLSPPQSRT